MRQGAEPNGRNRRQELEKYRQRVREWDAIIKRLVEQNALGVLTDERFAVLSGEYEEEHRALKEKIGRLQTLLNQKRDTLQNASHFLNAFRQYTDITELTPALLHELIEKICIHNAEGTGKARTQRIDIHWRFVGLLPEN